jgi:branched-subunit amino acid ABC-type transport system permease component
MKTTRKDAITIGAALILLALTLTYIFGTTVRIGFDEASKVIFIWCGYVLLVGIPLALGMLILNFKFGRLLPVIIKMEAVLCEFETLFNHLGVR